MLLPPIRNLLHYQPSSKKKSSSLNNNRNSQKMIQYAPKIIKARYYTEEKDSHINRRLMNYISFDKVKANKNYTQICQQNLRRYHEEKQEMRQLQGNSQRALSQIKKMKLNLSPRGNAISLHMKTQKSTLEMKHSRKRTDSHHRNRMQTELASNENMQIRMKLKQQMRDLQQDCLKIKKYSQMSIRQIIEKDVAQNQQSKKRLLEGNRRHRLQGWLN